MPTMTEEETDLLANLPTAFVTANINQRVNLLAFDPMPGGYVACALAAHQTGDMWEVDDSYVRTYAALAPYRGRFGWFVRASEVTEEAPATDPSAVPGLAVGADTYYAEVPEQHRATIPAGARWGSTTSDVDSIPVGRFLAIAGDRGPILCVWPGHEHYNTMGNRAHVGVPLPWHGWFTSGQFEFEPEAHENVARYPVGHWFTWGAGSAWYRVASVSEDGTVQADLRADRDGTGPSYADGRTFTPGTIDGYRDWIIQPNKPGEPAPEVTHTFAVGDHVVLSSPHVTTPGGYVFTNEAPNGVGSTGVIDRVRGDGTYGIQWDGVRQHSSIHGCCLSPQPAPAAPVFEVGGRVNVTYPGWQGPGTITRVHANGNVTVRRDADGGEFAGRMTAFLPRQIEPLTEEPTPVETERPLAVGDRIIITDNGGGAETVLGDTGTITSINVDDTRNGTPLVNFRLDRNGRIVGRYGFRMQRTPEGTPEAPVVHPPASQYMVGDRVMVSWPRWEGPGTVTHAAEGDSLTVRRDEDGGEHSGQTGGFPSTYLTPLATAAEEWDAYYADVPAEHRDAIPEGATWGTHASFSGARLLSIQDPDVRDYTRILFWPGHARWDSGRRRREMPEGWTSYRTSHRPGAVEGPAPSRGTEADALRREARRLRERLAEVEHRLTQPMTETVTAQFHGRVPVFFNGSVNVTVPVGADEATVADAMRAAITQEVLSASALDTLSAAWEDVIVGDVTLAEWDTV